MNPKVDAYIEKKAAWSVELALLREMFLSTGMQEEVKWGGPVYTVNGKNVTGMAAFKNHCAIWFFNGVFLKDEHNLLVSAQESTRGLRQIRFEKGKKIDMDIVRAYVLEAMENEQKGLKIKPKRTSTYEMPEHFSSALDANSAFKTAFFALTPGKQKEYAEYISEAKQEKTKFSRLEKIEPMIMEGKGLHDKYKNC